MNIYSELLRYLETWYGQSGDVAFGALTKMLREKEQAAERWQQEAFDEDGRKSWPRKIVEVNEDGLFVHRFEGRSPTEFSGTRLLDSTLRSAGFRERVTGKIFEYGFNHITFTENKDGK